jgi:hypothetical protein
MRTASESGKFAGDGAAGRRSGQRLRRGLGGRGRVGNKKEKRSLVFPRRSRTRKLPLGANVAAGRADAVGGIESRAAAGAGEGHSTRVGELDSAVAGTRPRSRKACGKSRKLPGKRN